MNIKEIGKIIARTRKDKGVTTYDLQKIGVHPHQIRAIEAGRGYNISTLKKVIDRLQLTVVII